METLGYTFAPQGNCASEPASCPIETLTNIHDETAKSIYASIELLTALLTRTRGSQPSGNSAGEKADRTLLRDASAIRSGAYRVNEMVSQLSGLI